MFLSRRAECRAEAWNSLTRVTVVRHVRLAWIVNADQSQWWQADILDIVLFYVNGRLVFADARVILLTPMRWAYENRIDLILKHVSLNFG